MHRCTKIDKYDVLSINVCNCEPTSMDEGGGVDKGSSVVDGVVSHGGWRGGNFSRGEKGNLTQC